MASDLLSKQSLTALGFVTSLVVGANVGTNTLLPKASSTKSRTINSTTSFLAFLWQDYARADARWGFADPTVVSLEILTVLGCGPIAAYCCYLMTKNNPAYHFWVVVLSVSELYGGFMTFCPEWLTGNKYLNGSTFLFFYVYLCFMNLAWVFIPFYLIYDSYGFIVKGLKVTGARPVVGGKKSK